MLSTFLCFLVFVCLASGGTRCIIIEDSLLAGYTPLTLTLAPGEYFVFYNDDTLVSRSVGQSLSQTGCVVNRTWGSNIAMGGQLWGRACPSIGLDASTTTFFIDPVFCSTSPVHGTITVTGPVTPDPCAPPSVMPTDLSSCNATLSCRATGACPASSVNTAAIIGGAVGGFVALVLIAILLYWLCTRKPWQDWDLKKKKKQQQKDEQQVWGGAGAVTPAVTPAPPTTPINLDTQTGSDLPPMMSDE